MSTALNLAVFGALQPVRVSSSPPPARYRLHRLQRVEVSTRATALTAPLDGPVEFRAPQTVWSKTLPATAPARRSAARKAPVHGLSRDRGPLAPRRPSGPPAARPGGGDGTRRTPSAPEAGGGSPLPATPREVGDPTAPGAAGPALGAVPAVPAPARAGHGPPLLGPTPGDGGGTATAPFPGHDPLPGTAGSGDRPAELAPVTMAGFKAPLAPTTPGPRLRDKAGPGLPELRAPAILIPATPIDPHGRSGGGGGTAEIPGDGGGGPSATAPLAGDRHARGGGGSGRPEAGPEPGGVELGPGPGGGGGGGDGLSDHGDGGGGQAPRGEPRPMATGGTPSVIHLPGRGQPGGLPVRPGKRVPGPGGAPSPAANLGLAGPGGRGRGDGGQGGEGGVAAAVARSRPGASDLTGAVIDTLALRWHHYPTSYDLRVGTADGPLLAAVQVLRYPSVASATSSKRVERHGRREVLVIRPVAIEFVARAGEGVRQRVVISADDARRLKESGLLGERGRLLTVYKRNY